MSPSITIQLCCLSGNISRHALVSRIVSSMPLIRGESDARAGSGGMELGRRTEILDQIAGNQR